MTHVVSARFCQLTFCASRHPARLLIPFVRGLCSLTFRWLWTECAHRSPGPLQCGSITLTGMRCNNGPSSTPAQVRAQTTPERRMESASQKASCCPGCEGDTVVRRAGAWRPRLGCARADGHLLCLGAESIPVCADLNALVAHRGFLAEGFGKVVVHESGCCQVLTRRC